MNFAGFDHVTNQVVGNVIKSCKNLKRFSEDSEDLPVQPSLNPGQPF